MLPRHRLQPLRKNSCFCNREKVCISSEAINLRAGTRFDNGAELDFHWLNSDSETEFDGGFQNYSESEQEVISGITLWECLN